MNMMCVAYTRYVRASHRTKQVKRPTMAGERPLYSDIAPSCRTMVLMVYQIPALQLTLHQDVLVDCRSFQHHHQVCGSFAYSNLNISQHTQGAHPTVTVAEDSDRNTKCRGHAITTTPTALHVLAEITSKHRRHQHITKCGGECFKSLFASAVTMYTTPKA